MLVLSLGLGMAVTAGVTTGLINPPGRGPAQPRCEELPTKAEVAKAVSEHGDLVQRLERIGSGVSVGISGACGNAAGIVSIAYRSSRERKDVNDLMAQEDGFGVPARLVPRR